MAMCHLIGGKIRPISFFNPLSSFDWQTAIRLATPLANSQQNRHNRSSFQTHCGAFYIVWVWGGGKKC